MFALGIVLSTIFVSVVSLLLIFLLWFRSKYFTYWKDRSVPYIEPFCIFGSVTNEVLKKKSWRDFSIQCYSKFKGHGYGGYYFFCYPSLIVCNPDLVEKVLSEDFSHFVDRGSAHRDEPMLKTLFNAKGEQWREMRHRLIPSFTSLKVKGMFEQILKCYDCAFRQMDTGEPIHMETVAFMYSTEVIGSCAFGIHLLTHPEEIRRFRHAVNAVFNGSLFQMVRYMLIVMFPKIFRMLGVNVVDHDATNLFMNLTKDIIKYRKDNQIKRSDFLQLLISLKEEEDKAKKAKKEEFSCEEDENEEKSKKKSFVGSKTSTKAKLFTDDRIAALVFNFVTAGLKPSVSTISFSLFEVAKNSTVQKRLQEEVDSTIRRHKGWNYDALKEMVYLDQVIQETLRLYSFNTFLMRTVTEPYTLPGTNLILEKDLFVYIPLIGLHMDPQRYPSPETFDPDRFEGNNYKPSPFYMPFGNGPRICIAVKFALLVLKTCLAKTISNYAVHLSSKTQTPLVLENEVYPKAKGGIWLLFKKRKYET